MPRCHWRVTTFVRGFDALLGNTKCPSNSRPCGCKNWNRKLGIERKTNALAEIIDREKDSRGHIMLRAIDCRPMALKARLNASIL
jgi:hypothetical protein